MILGIDPGYSLGYAVVDNGRVKIHGTLKTRGTPPERLARIRDLVNSLVEEFKVSIIAIETAFYGKSVPSLIKLAETRGVVLSVAGERGIEVMELHPSRIKRGITGNGRADKRQVIYMVEKITGLKELSEHEADAIAAALCAYEEVKLCRR